MDCKSALGLGECGAMTREKVMGSFLTPAPTVLGKLAVMFVMEAEK